MSALTGEPKSVVKQLLGDLLRLTQVVASPSPPPPAASGAAALTVSALRAVLKQAADGVSHNATKFALALGSAELDARGATVVSGGLRHAVTTLVSTCQTLNFLAGSALREAVQHFTSGVVQATVQLCKVAMVDRTSATRAQGAGKVWDALKKLDEVPKSNRRAVRAVMVKHATVVKDSIAELKEAIELAGTERTSEQEAMAGMADDEWFVMEDDEPMTLEEAVVARRAVVALQHVLNLYQSTLACLWQVRDASLNEDMDKAVVTVCDRVAHVKAKVVDLADAVCSPDTATDAETCFTNLSLACQTIVEAMSTTAADIETATSDGATDTAAVGAGAGEGEAEGEAEVGAGEVAALEAAVVELVIEGEAEASPATQEAETAEAAAAEVTAPAPRSLGELVSSEALADLRGKAAEVAVACRAGEVTMVE